MDKAEKKQLTLDYSKWICGERGEYPLGEGPVALLNRQGYMCCLGQWSIQLGASQNEILGLGEPHEINKFLPGLTIMDNEEEYEDEPPRAKNTKFSDYAMEINDDMKTTPDRKIELLSALCDENGMQLIVINKP